MPTLKKTVYISKFVETEGVFALEVEYDPEVPNTVRNPRQNRVFQTPDWHETRSEAAQAARDALTRMLRQVRERTERLERQLTTLDTAG